MREVPRGRNETLERRNGEPSAACERKESQSFSRGPERIVYTRAVRKLWLCGLEEQIIHWISVMKPDLKVSAATSYHINRKNNDWPRNLCSKPSLVLQHTNNKKARCTKLKKSQACNSPGGRLIRSAGLLFNYSSHQRKPRAD